MKLTCSFIILLRPVEWAQCLFEQRPIISFTKVSPFVKVSIPAAPRPCKVMVLCFDSICRRFILLTKGFDVCIIIDTEYLLPIKYQESYKLTSTFHDPGHCRLFILSFWLDNLFQRLVLELGFWNLNHSINSQEDYVLHQPCSKLFATYTMLVKQSIIV